MTQTQRTVLWTRVGGTAVFGVLAYRAREAFDLGQLVMLGIAAVVAVFVIVMQYRAAGRDRVRK